MAETQRISVPIEDGDRATLQRRLKKLPGMSEANLARILLRYGILNAGKAMAELFEDE